MKEIILPFGKLFFSEDYIIVKLADGIGFDEAESTRLVAEIRAHFGGRLCGYISNRINDNSVNPLRMRRVIEETSIAVAGIIVRSMSAVAVAEAEKKFYPCHVGTFSELEAGISWVCSYLKDMVQAGPD